MNGAQKAVAIGAVRGGKRAASDVRRLAKSSKCFSTIVENSKEDLWQQKSEQEQ
jgi:hypothetical protein